MPPRSVVAVVFPGLQALDLIGPTEVLDVAGRLSGYPECRLTVAATRSGPIRTSSGVEMSDIKRRSSLRRAPPRWAGESRWKLPCCCTTASLRLTRMGPYEVLSRLPGATTTSVGRQPGAVRADNGQLAMVADAALEDVADPDIVVTPGGPGQELVMSDGPILEWLRRVHGGATWTTSVCTGSAGACGSRSLAGSTGNIALACPRPAPVVRSRCRCRTGRLRRDDRDGGGSHCWDRHGLAACPRHRRKCDGADHQLAIEYDPQPSHGADSPATAPPEVVGISGSGVDSCGVAQQPMTPSQRRERFDTDSS